LLVALVKVNNSTSKINPSKSRNAEDSQKKKSRNADGSSGQEIARKKINQPDKTTGRLDDHVRDVTAPDGIKLS
jgi:hypothetical protein